MGDKIIGARGNTGTDTMHHTRDRSWTSIAAVCAAVWLAGVALIGGSSRADEEVVDEVVTRTHADHEQVFVGSGLFWMGLTEETGRTNEQPQHQVWVSDFWLDRYEVTNARYRECVDAGVCVAPKRYYKADDHPVVYVSWEMADTYCRFKEMRLPTEAEWEKAATWCASCLDPEHKRTYPWGNEPPTCRRAVFDEEEFGCGDQATWPVGSKRGGASAYGAMDMAGNVWEWVGDWYDSRAYVDRDSEANPTGPETGETRVMRGGSFATKPPYLRAAGRLKYLPEPTMQDVGVGFRCAVAGGLDGASAD